MIFLAITKSRLLFLPKYNTCETQYSPVSSLAERSLALPWNWHGIAISPYLAGTEYGTTTRKIDKWAGINR